MLNASHRIDIPEPGFFKLRLLPGRPFVPAAIFLPCPVDPYTGEQLDRGRVLMAAIGNNDPDYESIEKVWMFGCPISLAEYRYMRAVSNWAAQHAPAAPEASPLAPIDHLRTPINF